MEQSIYDIGAYYRVILKEELESRTARNPRYSLRAYAKALQLNSSHLSRILKGKASLSIPLGQKISKALSFNSIAEKQFIQSLVDEKLPEGSTPTTCDVLALNIDTFSTIANVIHYAIMELSFIRGFVSTAAWMAQRLGAAEATVSAAVQRLERLGLMRRDGDRLVKVDTNVTTADRSVTSAALRLHQKEVLSHAYFALDHVPYEQRHAQSMTIAINTKNIPLAKKMINDFMEQLAGVLETGDRDEVYELGVNLFPLTNFQQVRPDSLLSLDSIQERSQHADS